MTNGVRVSVAGGAGGVGWGLHGHVRYQLSRQYCRKTKLIKKSCDYEI